MADLSQEETKTIYEISKLTSPTKQIMDDFTTAVVMVIFKEFVLTHEQPEEALVDFMDQWQGNILEQKKDELEALSTQHDSMINMVVGQKISEQEDFKAYTEEVLFVKDFIYRSVQSSFT